MFNLELVTFMVCYFFCFCLLLARPPTYYRRLVDSSIENEGRDARETLGGARK